MTSATELSHAVVSSEQWLAARKTLLLKEKELTRQRDEVSRLRRELPWEKVEKRYVFEGPDGKETLSDLFDGRSQLLVYHFMLAPGWAEGCKCCSFLADHFDASIVHLAQRDVTLVVSSRAPLAEIDAFQKRMGWRFKWVSSFGSDFNFDYQVSSPQDEAPGLSAFCKDEADGEVFHTYSTYARGLDILIGAYNFLDFAPKGRDEDGLPWGMAWVRHHDRYEGQAKAAATCCHKEEARL